MLGEKTLFMLNAARKSLKRRRKSRTKETVQIEYGNAWSQFHRLLDASKSIDEWLRIPGVDEANRFHSIDGRLQKTEFNSTEYYRSIFVRALDKYFPGAQSAVEFGAGVGRNVLYLKHTRPYLTVSGYELCQTGVEVAESAAKKFGVDAAYASLDYLEDPAEKYRFGEVDVGFTIFSLEQIPNHSRAAVGNMLRSVRLGLIHIEPVPECYPLSFLGLLGRLSHWKSDYLRGFDESARSFEGVEVISERLETSHNPLMFPSLFVLRKNARECSGS